MTVKKILHYGDPVLLKRSEEVIDFSSELLISLVKDLEDTMQAHNGAGLAAPQIGILKRVVIFGNKQSVDKPRYPDAEHVPYTVLINPQITVLSDSTQGMWEGCLSVPGMRGYVERPDHIHYRGFDLQGNVIDREVSGFHAIVLQHECDHLDGILYPMKLSDPRMFGFEEEIAKSLSSQTKGENKVDP